MHILIIQFYLTTLLETGFNVVAREETRHPVHHSFPPPVIILLGDKDDSALREGQLIVFVLDVVIDGNNCNSKRQGSYKKLKVKLKNIVGGTTLLKNISCNCEN